VALGLGELATGHAGVEGLQDHVGTEADLEEGREGGREGRKGRKEGESLRVNGIGATVLGLWDYLLMEGGREGGRGRRGGQGATEGRREGGREGREQRTFVSNIFLILGRDMPLRSTSARIKFFTSAR